MVQFKCGKPADVTELGESSAFVNTGDLLDWLEPRTIDLFKQARLWMSLSPVFYSPEQLVADGHVDAQGRIVSLPVGITTLRTYLMIYNPTYATPANLSYLSGTYTITWSGSATIAIEGVGVSGRVYGTNTATFVYDATTPSAQLWVDVTPNLADTPYGWSCIPASHAADHAAGKIYRQNMFADLAGFAGHRLMKLANTENNPVVTWAQRPLLTDFTWRLPLADMNGNIKSKAVPLEAQIAYGNESGKHPWFCMPYLSDEDYMTNAAIMIRDTLDPDLIAFVEFANENWNDGVLAQVNWGRAQADALWGTELTGLTGYAEWAAYRSTRMAVIFRAVFAGQLHRLRIIMGGMIGNAGHTNRILTAAAWHAVSPAEWVDPKSVHDYLAITGYFGANALVDNAAAIMTALATSQATAVSLILDTLCPPKVTETKGFISEQIALANAAGLKTCMYENQNHLHLQQASGTSMYSGLDPAAGVLDMMQAVYDDPRLEAMKEDIRGHFKLAGGTFDCVFQDYSSTSKYGGWWWKRHMGDTTAGSTGLAAWSAANPRWYHY